MWQHKLECEVNQFRYPDPAVAKPLPDTCFYLDTSTHLPHAELGAGAGLTRDRLEDSGAAVGVYRHDLQEEGLEGDKTWKSKERSKHGDSVVR